MNNPTTPSQATLKFLEFGAVTAAEQLIGWHFYRLESDGLIGGVITETEAYTQQDAASHSYKGETPRTQVMFGPPGHLYVYFTYGMHHCVNIVTGLQGQGEAVLIRSLITDQGLSVIRTRRKHLPDHQLTNGPAKICQALAINLSANGARLNDGEFLLLPPETQFQQHPPTKRVGISKDTHRLWRFTAR